MSEEELDSTEAFGAQQGGDKLTQWIKVIWKASQNNCTESYDSY